RTGGLGRTAGQGVLHDAEAGPALEQLATKSIDLGHRQAAIVRDDHRVRVAELLRQLVDDTFLVLFLHFYLLFHATSPQLGGLAERGGASFFPGGRLGWASASRLPAVFGDGLCPRP